MTPDIINGAFEFLGASFIARNCCVLWHDRQVRGVSIYSTGFFTSWGLWNLFYYPSLGQWVSFAAGACLALTNVVWIILAVRFSSKGYDEFSL